MVGKLIFWEFARKFGGIFLWLAERVFIIFIRSPVGETWLRFGSDLVWDSKAGFLIIIYSVSWSVFENDFIVIDSEILYDFGKIELIFVQKL